MFTLIGRTFIVTNDNFGRSQVHLLTHSNGKTNEGEFFNIIYAELINGNLNGCATFRGMKINYRKYHKKIFSSDNAPSTSYDTSDFLVNLIFSDLRKYERKIEYVPIKKPMEKTHGTR